MLRNFRGLTYTYANLNCESGVPYTRFFHAVVRSTFGSATRYATRLQAHEEVRTWYPSDHYGIWRFLTEDTIGK
jgi:hypothetical protein